LKKKVQFSSQVIEIYLLVLVLLTLPFFCVITLNLFGIGGPTSSYASASIDLKIT